VDILFPSKGYYPNAAREGQPGNTTPDCLNVLPFDRDFRGRGAPRPGTSKFFSNQLSTSTVQLLRTVPVALAAVPSGPGSALTLFTLISGFTGGAVVAANAGTYGGHGASPSSGSDQALFWTDPSTPIDLAPPGATESTVNSLNAVRQVGQSALGGIFTAGYWTGSAASWTALPVPGGTSFGSAQGVSPDDSMIGGSIASGLASNHAVSWTQTAGVWGSPVDLTANISSYSTLYSSSSAMSCDGVICVVQAFLKSNGNSVTYIVNPVAGTATELGLSGSYLYSSGTCLGGGYIGGFVQGSDEVQHAALWSTGALSTLIDMSPPGSVTSIINSTSGTNSVGLKTLGGTDLAVLWEGVNINAVPLQTDVSFSGGYVALAIDSGGEISGFGLDSSSNQIPAGWALQAAGIIPPIQRRVVIVAVAGGSLFGGPGDAATLPAVTGGSGVLSPFFLPQFAARTTKGYVVDTLHDLIQIDLPTMTVETFTPTAGSETATTLGAYSLACMWRDRLVFAASVATPQNFVMSRQGVPTDFDYGQDDSAAAVAGNASRVGSIGEPLNCLMPWTDDILILGGDHSIYKVEGDIAAGGQIVNVSQAVGTLGPDCWDVDPVGNLYFVGSDGLYIMPPGGIPQNISSGSVREFFSGINRSLVNVSLSWDRDRHGCYVFVTTISSGASTHLWYDATNQAFFPVQYAPFVGPVVSLIYDGDDPLDRQILLGGRDGYIRFIDPTSLDDDGTDFDSHVWIGPIRPGGTDASLAVLQAMEVIVGEVPNFGGFTSSNWGLTISIVTGKDAFTAITTPQSVFSFNVTLQARRKRILQRVSGGSWYFKVSSTGTIWSFEKLVPLFTPGGLQRRY
jgi:hypothetical protein